MTEPQPASLRDRVAATGVDLLLVLLLGALTLTFTGDLAAPVRFGLLLLVIGLPTFVVEGTFGRSLGKAGVGLRHAPPLTIPQTAGRFTLKWVAPTVLLVLGLWLAALAWWIADGVLALGPSHRTAHDRLTRSRVLGSPERERAEGS